MRGLALGGFMGVGKSSTGRVLAARTGLPFVDTDQVLVDRFGPIAAQFATDGPSVFRARERDVVRQVCAGRAAVIATGGGVWADPELREALADYGARVVLWASLATLQRRLATGQDERPLWGRAQALLRERREAYADTDACFRTDNVPIEVVADRVEVWWTSV